MSGDFTYASASRVVSTAPVAELSKVGQEAQRPPLGGSFIVFGGPRSGTTLLAQCLSAHSKIIIPYETDILATCAFILDRVKDPTTGRRLITELITNSYYFGVSLGVYLTVEEVRSSIEGSEYSMPSIFTNLYSTLGAKAGKPIAGDKSPYDLFDVFILSRVGMLDEPIRIIHIVRDIRDVMVSLNRQDWFPNADLYFPRLWAERNLFLRTQMQDRANYFSVRYEDFVVDPARWLKLLSSFLAVEFEERMLDTASFPSVYKTISAHNHLHDPIGPRHIGQWKTLASSQQIEMYRSQAGDALREFGYLE
jgi:hypothetical protein